MKYIFSQSDLSSTYEELKKELNSYLQVGEKLVKEGTPEDSFDLTNDILIEEAKKVGPIVSGSIYLDPAGESREYAEYVEYGVPSGQERNYYKNSGRRNGGSPFLTSRTGARMFSNGGDKLEKYINSKIK